MEKTRRFLNRLIEPSATLVGRGERRQARLLALLILVFIPLTVLMMLATLAAPPTTPYYGHHATFFALLALLVSYGLSRTRYYDVGALIITLVSSLVPFIISIYGTVPIDTDILVYLVLSVLLSSIFMPLKATAWVILTNALALLLLPIAFEIELWDILGGVFGYYVVGSGLTLLVAHYHGTLEEDRRVDLAASEAKYRTVVENAGEAIVVAQDGIIQYANSMAYRLGGFSSDALIDKPFVDFVHPEDRQLTRDRYMARMGGQDISSVHQLRIIVASGETRWAELWAVTIDWQGEPATLNFMSDITQRVNAERELQESERRYRLLAENSRDVIWTIDLEGIFTYVSPSVQRLRGFTPEQMMARPLSEALTQESYQVAVEALASGAQAAQRGDIFAVPSRYEFEQPCSDGSTIWTEAVISPLFDSGHRVVGYLGVSRDIEERKKAEQALRDSEERFRQLAENIDILFWLESPDGTNKIYVSPAFESIWGIPRQVLVDRPNVWRDVVHPDDLSVVQDAFSSTRQGESRTYEYRIIHPDASVHWIRSQIYPIYDEKGALYRIAGIAADITEVRALEERLREVEKMEAIGRLAGGVAHEFNNLLTVINGYARIVADELGPNHAQYADLVEIESAGHRAAELTGQLLAFGRRQLLSMQTLNLNDEMRRMTKTLHALLSESIDVEESFADDLLPVRADVGQINHVITNLVTNAQAAMVHGGTLSLATGNVESLDPALCREMGLGSGAYVRLSVSDTGHGMVPEVKARVFEPFFTTKELGQGTGLGLATVYGIVKQLNGGITVESEPGQGATFRVYLPEAGQRLGEIHGLGEDAVSQDRETILVLEDDPSVRRVAARMLKGLGYATLQMSHPHEAIARCQSRRDAIDLVLMDVDMLEMCGPELGARLHEICPDLALVYMTDYADGDMNPRTFERDLSRIVVHKPLQVRDLASKIRRALAQHHGGS